MIVVSSQTAIETTDKLWQNKKVSSLKKLMRLLENRFDFVLSQM